MRLLIALCAAIFAVSAGRASAAVAPVQIEIPHDGLKLKALLYRPAGDGPFPAIVALHGCGGLHNRTGAVATSLRDWGQRLVAAGFAVIYPDSYGSRGLTNQCRATIRTARVDRERVADANAARAWLQSQPWVAADRVSLLGWSTGASATLWSVRPRPALADSSPDFRSAVAFYPGCNRLYRTAWAARVPTLILIGSLDDETSPAICRQMVAGARGRSAAISLHVYQGAYHDFDHPNRPLHVRTGYAFSVDGSGRINTGTNPAARADALKRVPQWLSR
jgi:dienelactone hydrolase